MVSGTTLSGLETCAGTHKKAEPSCLCPVWALPKGIAPRPSLPAESSGDARIPAGMQPLGPPKCSIFLSNSEI